MSAPLALERQALPPDTDEPTFAEPWQAQAFALVVSLHQAGLFAWQDWVKIFSETIVAAPATPAEDVNSAYYRQWLLAMERLVEHLGLATPTAIAQRAAEWRQAYLNTPHGQPVVLANAHCPPSQTPEHPPRREPVVISPAHR